MLLFVGRASQPATAARRSSLSSGTRGRDVRVPGSAAPCLTDGAMASPRPRVLGDHPSAIAFTHRERKDRRATNHASHGTSHDPTTGPLSLPGTRGGRERAPTRHAAPWAGDNARAWGRRTPPAKPRDWTDPPAKMPRAWRASPDTLMPDGHRPPAALAPIRGGFNLRHGDAVYETAGVRHLDDTTLGPTHRLTSSTKRQAGAEQSASTRSQRPS